MQASNKTKKTDLGNAIRQLYAALWHFAAGRVLKKTTAGFP
ncbi:hypothetical protein [Variovorax sp. Root411]|nr:hypothetical protein [Variovorax sp. Root411]